MFGWGRTYIVPVEVKSLARPYLFGKSVMMIEDCSNCDNGFNFEMKL